MNIHPTAVIHPDAVIADDAKIGAYVCIEGPVVVGEGCIIQSHAILTGSVQLGKFNTIGYGAVIGAEPQDLSFKPEIQSHVAIGDHNQIREYCTIHRGSTEGSVTRVGNHNYFMVGVHLGHNSVIGNHVIIANNVLLGGHVEIQDRVFVGGGCVFHQFLRIGSLAMVRGGCAFSKDIPPFLIAAGVNSVAGLNVVGLRRAGFSADDRKEAKEAFKLLYRSGLNTRQALEESRNRTWGNPGNLFFDFVSAAKKRGICDLMESKPGAGEPTAEL